MITNINMTLNRLKRAGFRVNAIHIGADNPATQHVSIVEPTLFGVPVVAVSGDAIAYDIDAGPVSLVGRNVVTLTSVETGNRVKSGLKNALIQAGDDGDSVPLMNYASWPAPKGSIARPEWLMRVAKT